MPWLYFKGKKRHHNYWIKYRISGHSTPHPHQHIKQVERRVSIHTHLTRTRALQWTQWEIWRFFPHLFSNYIIDQRLPRDTDKCLTAKLFQKLNSMNIQITILIIFRYFIPTELHCVRCLCCFTTAVARNSCCLGQFKLSKVILIISSSSKWAKYAKVAVLETWKGKINEVFCNK